MYLNESESLVSGLQSAFFCFAALVLLSGNCKLGNLGVELFVCFPSMFVCARCLKLIGEGKWVTEN